MTSLVRGVGRRWAAATTLVAVLLGGCGSNDSDTPEAPPAATPGAAPGGSPALKSAVDVGAPLTAGQLDAAVSGTTAAALAGPARCDVQLVDLTYRTTAPDGATPTEASGVMMIPTGAGCPGPFPLVAYSRGTDLDKVRALATPGDDEARLVAGLLASQGFIVAATDYLGYARSTWPEHPYLHANSEATANVDALRAAREVAGQRGIALNAKVFVAGYSQGGHASMATQKLIETSLASEFALVGAGHLSGVYNLVDSVRSALSRLPLGELGSTYYVPFAVTALQEVYGNLYSRPREFFKSPYDETIESLFPTAMDVGLQDLIDQNRMPILLSSLVTNEFITAAFNDASPLNRALVLNTTTSFVPKASTLLCGGSRDPVVNYRNTEDAVAAFRAAGAPAVRAFDVEQESSFQALLRDDLLPADVNSGYHASLVPPLCLLQARNLFLTL